jgi:hypothetical protein
MGIIKKIWYDIEGYLFQGGGGGIFRDQSFANDTTIYLKCYIENIDKFKVVLDVFCSTSRLKINSSKFVAI